MIDLLRDFAFSADETLRGIDLSPFGIHNFGWPRQAALVLVDLLRTRTIAVLGGDVLQFHAERPHHTYDNWFISPLSNEDFTDFVTRSCARTQTYIQSYREAGKGYVYTLVLANHLPSSDTTNMT